MIFAVVLGVCVGIVFFILASWWDRRHHLPRPF